MTIIDEIIYGNLPGNSVKFAETFVERGTPYTQMYGFKLDQAKNEFLTELSDRVEGPVGAVVGKRSGERVKYFFAVSNDYDYNFERYFLRISSLLEFMSFNTAAVELLGMYKYFLVAHASDGEGGLVLMRPENSKYARSIISEISEDILVAPCDSVHFYELLNARQSSH